MPVLTVVFVRVCVCVCMCVCSYVCVCVCVSLCIISGEEKREEGTELILSVYQKLSPSVIEFSPSPIVAALSLGTGWSDVFFPSQVQL